MHIYLFIKQYIIRIYVYPHYVNSADKYTTTTTKINTN